jgi:plasmid stabilization system protein ParE
MAEVVWTEPALSDLEAIADYIALDNPVAAAELVRRVLEHVGQLAEHLRSGSTLPELPGWRYRQIIEPPCRAIYRQERDVVFILHVIRSERLLKRKLVAKRSRSTKK